MSAGQEISINSNEPIKKLGIIAGGGTLPRDLCLAVQAQNIECHVIGFKGYTNFVTPDFWGKIDKSSKIIAYLNHHKIKDIVFIGAIDRPNIWQLRPDWITFKFFFTAWIKSLGDSSLLSAARTELQKMGFTLHGIHSFMPELLMPEDILGKVEIHNTPHDDIYLGVKEALEWGASDKGQAVIVNNGEVIAREDSNGTNYMIDNFGQAHAILVKMCKPQQDTDLDLPTIGLSTVQHCIDKKMAGIIGHAGKMLVAEKEEMLKLANENNIFILGYNIDV